MDAHFDQHARQFVPRTGRRRVLGGLLSGGLAGMLGAPAAETRRKRAKDQKEQ
jgi:hypothetical protein